MGFLTKKRPHKSHFCNEKTLNTHKKLLGSTDRGLPKKFSDGNCVSEGLFRLGPVMDKLG